MNAASMSYAGITGRVSAITAGRKRLCGTNGSPLYPPRRPAAEQRPVGLQDQGRTQQLWRVDFTDESGRLIAHGELRLQNVAGKS